MDHAAVSPDDNSNSNLRVVRIVLALSPPSYAAKKSCAASLRIPICDIQNTKTRPVLKRTYEDLYLLVRRALVRPFSNRNLVHISLRFSGRVWVKFQSNRENHFYGLIWLETDRFNEYVSVLYQIVRLLLLLVILYAGHLLCPILNATVCFLVFFYYLH